MIERERLSESLLPAHERVYRTLRARVMHGQVAPGAALTLARASRASSGSA